MHQDLVWNLIITLINLPRDLAVDLAQPLIAAAQLINWAWQTYDLTLFVLVAGLVLAQLDEWRTQRTFIPAK